MKRNLTYLLPLLTLLAALAFPAKPGVRAEAAASPLLVVISSATGVTDISSALLRRAFEGLPAEYQSGKRLLPLNLPLGSAERARFDRVVLGLNPDEVGRFWVDQRVRGAAQPPRTLAVELAVRVVASFPGAISYLDSSGLKPGLQVLSIDGRQPGAAGYLLSR
jgi:hypothetical protein